MNIAVLDVATLGPEIDVVPLQKAGFCTFYDNTVSRELIISRLQGIEVAAVNKVQLRADVLSQLPDLRLICLFATGFDIVDIDYCREHGIAVCNVEGYSTESVAQLTLAMALSLSCHLSHYQNYVSDGRYTRSGIANLLEPTFHELRNMTWGIVGLGNIGGRVADMASAIGCKILGYCRHPGGKYPCTDLKTLCRESDIISIHTPLNSTTRGLIGKEQLELMKPNVLLINVARGAVMDEVAVAEAMAGGKLGGLGVDVYSCEPFGKDHPYYGLLGCENVCFTPHMGWGSLEARNRVIEEVSENILAFERGERRFRVD